MKRSFALAAAVVALATIPSLGAASSSYTSSHPSRYTRRHARKSSPNKLIGPSVSAAPRVPPFSSEAQPHFELPRIAPYPTGQGHADGLSRNTDDCNMGCIDY
jgi:hypothetical protein